MPVAQDGVSLSLAGDLMPNRGLKDAVEKAMPKKPEPKGKSGPVAQTVRVGPRLIRKIWGVSNVTLKKRGLKGVKGKYDLEEFWEMFAGHINDKMNAEVEVDAEGQDSPALLKIEKTKEEIRKLKIENDLKEAKTIDADEAMIEWAKQLKAIADVLDGIPSRVKMETPDVPQSVLDTVYRAVSDARNKAAEL